MDKKEFYNSLSEDIKAKLKACSSEKEMLDVLSENKIEIDPELLEGVSGGGRLHCSKNCKDWC